MLGRFRISDRSADSKGRVRSTALALCAAFSLAGAVPLQAQLAVDRLDMVINPASGKRTTGVILVTNQTAVPQQATLLREEWDRSENGDNRFLPAGSTGASCGAHLTFSPAVIRLEPGTSERVRVSMDGVPPLGKECWDAISIEQVLQQAKRGENAIHYRFRTAVKVYVTPDGLSREGAIEDMRLQDRSATERQIAINFRNTGGIHLLAKGSLEFRRRDNSVAARTPIPEFPTLPGALRKLAVDVPLDLPRGDYIVLALIDFGGAEIAAGQLDLAK